MRDILRLSYGGTDYLVGIIKTKYVGKLNLRFDLSFKRVDNNEECVIDFSKDIQQLPEFDAYFKDDNDVRSCVISELEKRDLILYLDRDVEWNNERYKLYQLSYKLLDLCSEGKEKVYGW